MEIRAFLWRVQLEIDFLHHSLKANVETVRTSKQIPPYFIYICVYICIYNFKGLWFYLKWVLFPQPNCIVIALFKYFWDMDQLL